MHRYVQEKFKGLLQTTQQVWLEDDQQGRKEKENETRDWISTN